MYERLKLMYCSFHFGFNSVWFQGFTDRKPGQIMGQQVPSHQQQPQQILQGPMQHPYQFQSLQGFPLTQPGDTRSQQQVPLGQYSSPQTTPQIYSQSPMPQRRAQQQVVTSMQQPVLQMPIVPHRQPESQPNPQPIVVQAGQSLQRQVLPVQTQMEQGATKEATQQVRREVLSWVSLRWKHLNSLLYPELSVVRIRSYGNSGEPFMQLYVRHVYFVKEENGSGH